MPPRRTVFNWEGDADEEVERRFAVRALRNFTTAIQRLPTKLRRIVDSLHAARRPKLTFMLSLPDGRDVVNDEEDEDVWTADDGFLRAATRDAHGLPPLEEHARVLRYINLAKELIRNEALAAEDTAAHRREAVENGARRAVERALRE